MNATYKRIRDEGSKLSKRDVRRAGESARIGREAKAFADHLLAGAVKRMREPKPKSKRKSA